jgi:hypothetical protein
MKPRLASDNKIFPAICYLVMESYKNWLSEKSYKKDIDKVIIINI